MFNRALFIEKTNGILIAETYLLKRLTNGTVCTYKTILNIKTY